jgi:hypothetical protein
MNNAVGQKKVRQMESAAAVYVLQDPILLCCFAALRLSLASSSTLVLGLQ